METEVEPRGLEAQAMPDAAVAPTNLEALTAFVTQTAAIFSLAGSPHNPQIATYWDALHFFATSLPAFRMTRGKTRPTPPRRGSRRRSPRRPRRRRRLPATS